MGFLNNTYYTLNVVELFFQKGVKDSYTVSPCEGMCLVLDVQYRGILNVNA